MTNSNITLFGTKQGKQVWWTDLEDQIEDHYGDNVVWHYGQDFIRACWIELPGLCLQTLSLHAQTGCIASTQKLHIASMLGCHQSDPGAFFVTEPAYSHRGSLSARHLLEAGRLQAPIQI